MLFRSQRKRSVVFFLSDFLPEHDHDSIEKAYERALGVASRRHDVVPLVIHDPAESDFPDVGLVPLQHLETGEILWFDSSAKSVRHAFRRRGAQMVAERLKIFRKHGMEPINAEVGGDYIPGLVGYFRRRASRQ